MIERMKASKAGFTLVELIVVIAILGILAGIAVPVYSGYISKAGEASDLQLLSAVNTAFSAACAEIGLDPTGIVGLASLTGDTGAKKIDTLTATGTDVDSDKAARLSDTFFLLYGDNKDATFKKFTSLGYDMVNGVFVDGEGKESAVTFAWGAGRTLTVSADDLAELGKSDFIFDGSNGVEDLLERVDQVVNIAASAKNKDGSSKISGTVNSEDFKNFIKEITGSDSTDGWSDTKLSNALVLYAAKNSSSLSSLANDNMAGQTLLQSYIKALQNFSSSQNVSADELSKAACAYGMMTAFGNWAENKSGSKTNNLITYMQTENGKQALNAYISSMSMITDNLGDPDSVNALLESGFDDTLTAAINSALGIG